MISKRISIWDVIKNEISKESLKSIRLILISGEKVPLDLPDKIHSIMPNARIVCLGGATEASIWSNYYEPKEINNKWFSMSDATAKYCPQPKTRKPEKIIQFIGFSK